MRILNKYYFLLLFKCIGVAHLYTLTFEFYVFKIYFLLKSQALTAFTSVIKIPGMETVGVTGKLICIIIFFFRSILTFW